MVFYAPTINSYKRYVDGSWAPTRLAWSYDNRTAGLPRGRATGRACASSAASRAPTAIRISRSPASLASRARRHRAADRAAGAFGGDVYAADDLPRVPRTLARGDRRVRGERTSPRRAFGDDVVEHYVHFFRTEQAAFDAAVTDWERRRYFERI